MHVCNQYSKFMVCSVFMGFRPLLLLLRTCGVRAALLTPQTDVRIGADVRAWADVRWTDTCCWEFFKMERDLGVCPVGGGGGGGGERRERAVP